MQRAIVEVRWGAESGTKKVLSPGDTLRIGRKPQSEWLIPDKEMSGVHFEIGFDGSLFKVRDLRSATGTLVGGQKIHESAELGNGGWIRAGETDFMVYIEASTPPEPDEIEEMLAADPEDLEPLAARWLEENRERLLRDKRNLEARQKEALERLLKVQGSLYAVLDAARSDRILTVLRESVNPYRSLYEGIDGEALEHVAPYLVELSPGSGLLERLVKEGWGKRWGIFIEFPRDFKELRRHLRRFLMIADADTRKKFYFRFYDPVVFCEFLPTCTPKQRAELFGEISAVIAEGPFARLVRFEAEVS